MPGCHIARIALAACCLAQTLFAADAALPARKWSLQDGDVLVLLGDDITHQALYSQYLEDFFLTRFPGKSIRVVNAGVHGSLTEDALDRFTADVAVHRPTHVAVLLGLNDAGLQPYRDDLFQEYRRDLTELDRRIRELQAVPIYFSPTMFDAKAARQRKTIDAAGALPLINATFAYYGVWLREFAEEAPALFVDLHGSLTRMTRQARLDQPDFTLIPDGIHPGPAGQLVIAATFLEDLGLERPLSAIQIAAGRDMLTATAAGGRVLNLQAATPGTISFLWQAEALPWHVPLEAASAGELLNLAERFNRETLQIQGLAAGTYELLIDDRMLGRFSRDELEKGIELHRLSTPQAEQARLIAAGNQDRTDAAIRPARDEWSALQDRSRLRAAAAAHPEDPGLLRKLAAIELLLSGFEERQARFSLHAETSLERLQEQAQPVPRQFMIRPVFTAEVQGRVLLGGMPISGAMVELHGRQGLAAVGTTDAMGFYKLNALLPDGIPPGDGWLVVLAKMVLPKFISLETSGHRVMLRSGVNEIELHFEETPGGE